MGLCLHSASTQPLLCLTMFLRHLLPLCLLLVLVYSQCEISIKNVGQVDFTWHIEYAGNWTHEKILYKDYHCYHYMNCIHNNDYEVEITDYAIYINVGHDNVEMCVVKSGIVCIL